MDDVLRVLLLFPLIIVVRGTAAGGGAKEKSPHLTSEGVKSQSRLLSWARARYV